MDKKETKRIDDNVKLGLFIVGFTTLGFLIAAALTENVFTEWGDYRNQYADILQEMAVDERTQTIADNFDIQMQQNVVPALDKIDRCITCHAGVDDPRMVDQPQPFTTHPGNYINDHSMDKFGCTICHQGQGRAVEYAEAKAVGHHWDYPALPAELTQSSCGLCHSSSELEHTGGEKYVYGKQLYDEKGCNSCHKLNSRGGSLGPELDGIGMKVKAQLPMAEIKGEHTLSQWLMEHFDNPQLVVENSQMKPPGLSYEENLALTIYMLSLQGRDLPNSYISPERHQDYFDNANPADMSGLQLYNKFCFSCHSEGTQGIYDKTYDKFIPAIRGSSYSQLATKEYLTNNIASGRPGTLMSGWMETIGGLTDEEISKLVDYLKDVEVPEDAKLDANLIAATSNPEMQFRGDPEAGKSIFIKHCISCHGENGMGLVAPSLNSAAFQSASDGFIWTTISIGRKNTAMPSFFSGKGDGLSAPQVNHLVSYIRSLRSN